MARRAGRPAEPLPSHASSGVLVGGILGALDYLLLKRPRPVTQIEEPYREPWATLDGIEVEGLDERPERPEPPDRSGARL
ncbi:MAG: hypothetical protein E6I62_01150 [Chloroflexi bacterium]|jgi:hypothetical protein|nr:MAG: hypothetical protein E6I62_01150 [Chloroflexota bacterium]